MRIASGVIAALAVALGLTGWTLKGAWQDNARLSGENDALKVEVERSATRFEALDASVKKLGESSRANAQQLGQTLAAIRGIQREGSDTDETIKCLDVVVPAALDRSLRQPATRVPASGNPK